MNKSITVGELKKSLEGIPDNLPVTACFTGLTYKYHSPDNDGYLIGRAKIWPKCSIGNEQFVLELGEGFGW